MTALLSHRFGIRVGRVVWTKGSMGTEKPDAGGLSSARVPMLVVSSFLTRGCHLCHHQIARRAPHGVGAGIRRCAACLVVTQSSP